MGRIEALRDRGASTEDGSGKDGSTNEVAYYFFLILTTRIESEREARQ